MLLLIVMAGCGSGSDEPDRPSHRVAYFVGSGGSWTARAVDIEGAEAHVNTFGQAQRNIRSVIARVLNVDVDSFDLDESVEQVGDGIASPIDDVLSTGWTALVVERRHSAAQVR